jgi:hypothetical protein
MIISARRLWPEGSSGKEKAGTLPMLRIIEETQVNTKHQWKTLKWKAYDAMHYATIKIKAIILY